METDLEKSQTTAQNADCLIAMLEHKGLRYQIVQRTDAQTHIAVRFQGKDLPMTLHVVLRADRQIVSVYSAMPFAFPLERLQIAALACAAANHGMIDGSFDLDLETGELRFRLTSCYIDTVLSEALFSYLLYVSAETIDRYNDRFLLLSKGELELEDFECFVNGLESGTQAQRGEGHA